MGSQSGDSKWALVLLRGLHGHVWVNILTVSSSLWATDKGGQFGGQPQGHYSENQYYFLNSAPGLYTENSGMFKPNILQLLDVT